MIVYKMQRLLDAYLNSLSYPVDVVFPNVGYTPKADTEHVRATLLPTNHEDSTVNRTGYQRQEAVYQIDVYTPLDRGTTKAQEIAEAVITLFSRGTVLENAEVKVRVDKTSMDFTMREEDFWRTTISVYLSSIY